MERYVEKKRERRIRDFRRVVERAYRVTRRRWSDPCPDNPLGPRTWDEWTERRRREARRVADNLTICSCALCGNPRRFWGKTYREHRQYLAAAEQLIDAGFLDDSPGERDVLRKGTRF